MEAATQVDVRSGATDRHATATRVVALVLGIGYLTAGVVGALTGVSDDGSDLFWWLLLLVAGGALVLTGAFVLASRPFLSAAVTALGAAAGALALFWSVVAPVLALVLTALVVVRAVQTAMR